MIAHTSIVQRNTQYVALACMKQHASVSEECTALVVLAVLVMQNMGNMRYQQW